MIKADKGDVVLLDQANKGKHGDMKAVAAKAAPILQQTLDVAHGEAGSGSVGGHGVDAAIFEYRACLDNCREPYPVK